MSGNLVSFSSLYFLTSKLSCRNLFRIFLIVLYYFIYFLVSLLTYAKDYYDLFMMSHTSKFVRVDFPISSYEGICLSTFKFYDLLRAWELDRLTSSSVFLDIRLKEPFLLWNWVFDFYWGRNESSRLLLYFLFLKIFTFGSFATNLFYEWI